MPHVFRRYSQPLSIVATALLLSLLGACGKQPENTTTTVNAATTPAWSVFLDQYIEDYFKAHPTFAASQGRHEYDGKMPDWSAAGIANEIARLHRQRILASAYTNERLTERERFERDYLLAQIDRDLFWQENAALPFRNPEFYFDSIDSIDPAMYVSRPYASLEKRAQAFIVYANAIPKAAQQIRANLRLPMPATFVQFGVAGFGGLADFYRKDVSQVFATVNDAQVQQQLKTAIESAANAMQGLADWLKSNEKDATQDFAMGPKLFADMLWMTERVNTPLDRLEAIGRADLDRNLAALKDACKQYAPHATIQKCAEEMNADKEKGGAVEGARAQLAGLKQFIIDHKVVSIPGDEQVQVDQAPSYNAQNFAYIIIPGPYDQGLPSVYYIAPPDKAWSKAEQDAYLPGKADLLFTSVHEVWPGHFLQFLHSNRSSFRFGQLFVGYAFAEGWAHYSEEMMWESGLGNGDPETHIGQLQEALLRDVRFLCAIGLHTKGMTVAESEKMFREQGMQDAGNARQQAARGTRDPAYLNYTMGKLMIRKLRVDWTAKHGGSDAWREFHDSFLSYGGPPIPLVRAQMLPEQSEALF